MPIGDRIKRVRNLRGLTQRELGLAVGFEENTADVRIAQYETGTRTPKEEMLMKIASVLDVNFRALYEPSRSTAEDVMFKLFDLDEHYNLSIHDFDGKRCVTFNYKLLDDFIAEWQQRKKDLAEGTISKAEYMEWKLNWPDTADDLGKFPLKKQWRKPPETTV